MAHCLDVLADKPRPWFLRKFLSKRCGLSASVFTHMWINNNNNFTCVLIQVEIKGTKISLKWKEYMAAPNNPNGLIRLGSYP